MEVFLIDSWDQNKHDKQKNNFLRQDVALSRELFPLE